MQMMGMKADAGLMVSKMGIRESTAIRMNQMLLTWATWFHIPSGIIV